jgi:hypothetical protein
MGTLRGLYNPEFPKGTKVRIASRTVLEEFARTWRCHNPYGIRAVVHSAWSKEIADFVRREGAVELELNRAKGWHGSDLSFLAEMPGLESFEIFDFKSRILRRFIFLTTCGGSESRLTVRPRSNSPLFHA